MADDLTTRLREASLPLTLEMAMEGYVQDAHAVALHAEALSRIEALEAERDAALADVAKLRGALADYAERLRGADQAVTDLMGESHISDRLAGKREGVRLAIDYLRPILADTEEAKSDGDA